MTGDKVEKDSMTYSKLSDLEVAGMIRMLMRDDLNHEFVCVGARDRIMYLSQEVERLKKESEQILNDAIANIDRKAARIKTLEATISTFLHDLDSVPSENKPGVLMSSAMWLQVQAFRNLLAESV